MRAVRIDTEFGPVKVEPYARTYVVVRVDMAQALEIGEHRIWGWSEVAHSDRGWGLSDASGNLDCDCSLRASGIGELGPRTKLAKMAIGAICSAVGEWADSNPAALERAARAGFYGARRGWLAELREMAEANEGWTWTVGEPDLINGSPSLEAEIARFQKLISDARAGARSLADSVAKARYQPRASIAA